jgi:3-mercaptopyruvate sulfurtransferase SseA
MKALAATVALVAMLMSRALAAETPLLVTPAWLAERLGQPDVRVVDVSDPEDYAHGHIPARCISTSRTRA